MAITKVRVQVLNLKAFQPYDALVHCSIESAIPILKLVHRDSIEKAFKVTDADSITLAVGKSRG